MPLNTDDKTVASALKTLNQAVEVVCSRAQTPAQAIHRLMVQAVNPATRASQYLVQSAAWLYERGLARQRRTPVRGNAAHGAHILMQAPTQHHVEQLRAPANSKQGYAPVECPLNHRFFEPVAARIPWRLAIIHATVKRRIDIRTAADNDTVEGTGRVRIRRVQAHRVATGPADGTSREPPRQR